MKTRTYAVAQLPDGTEQKRETKHLYTWALAIDVPSKTGDGGWLVAQWSQDEKKIRASAKRLSVQWHGTRKVEVVPVVLRVEHDEPKPKKERAEKAEGELTGKQWACIAELRKSPASVWNFGSTTVNRLRREGYVAVSSGLIELTVKGIEKAEEIR